VRGRLRPVARGRGRAQQMTDGAMRRLLWRLADRLDYLLTLAWLRLWIVLTDFRGTMVLMPAPRPVGSKHRWAGFRWR